MWDEFVSGLERKMIQKRERKREESCFRSSSSSLHHHELIHFVNSLTHHTLVFISQSPLSFRLLFSSLYFLPLLFLFSSSFSITFSSFTHYSFSCWRKESHNPYNYYWRKMDERMWRERKKEWKEGRGRRKRNQTWLLIIHCYNCISFFLSVSFCRFFLTQFFFQFSHSFSSYFFFFFLFSTNFFPPLLHHSICIVVVLLFINFLPSRFTFFSSFSSPSSSFSPLSFLLSLILSSIFRWLQASRGQFACETSSEVMRPGWARDEITNEWMLVVSHSLSFFFFLFLFLLSSSSVFSLKLLIFSFQKHLLLFWQLSTIVV